MLSQKVSFLLLAVFAGICGGFLSARFSASYARETVPARTTNEIIVPVEGLIFKTEDGKQIAKLISIQDTHGRRNVFSIFNETGNREVELNAFSNGGDVSVYDNRDRGAALSIFASPTGGQLSLMGDLKSAIQLSAGKDGGLLTINESGGLPALTLAAKAHRGRIEIQENGGPEGRLLWHVP